MRSARLPLQSIYQILNSLQSFPPSYSSLEQLSQSSCARPKLNKTQMASTKDKSASDTDKPIDNKTLLDQSQFTGTSPLHRALLQLRDEIQSFCADDPFRSTEDQDNSIDHSSKTLKQLIIYHEQTKLLTGLTTSTTDGWSTQLTPFNQSILIKESNQTIQLAIQTFQEISYLLAFWTDIEDWKLEIN